MKGRMNACMQQCTIAPLLMVTVLTFHSDNQSLFEIGNVIPVDVEFLKGVLMPFWWAGTE